MSVMRILHYFLGFSRAGGLNRYAGDLAKTQVKVGHEVFALFPGGSIFSRNQARIFSKGSRSGVSCFELLGGKPVPLLEGIRDPQMILDGRHKLTAQDVIQFCDTVRPDVLHIHTWMGFPEELLGELKKRNCRIVFTTHDYFGLCPRVNFINAHGIRCEEAGNSQCTQCNRTAPGERFLALRNWGVLMSLKPILQPLRNCLSALRPGRKPVATSNDCLSLNYKELLKYYCGLLDSCHVIHCNSQVAAKIYGQYRPTPPLEVVPITHCGITDRKFSRKKRDRNVRLCFIGSDEIYKGLPLLLRVLRGFHRDGVVNWSLSVWGNSRRGPDSEFPAIRYHGTFPAKEQKRVFEKADLLVVPSVWDETFGFIVSEALSFGLPVVCSDTVGAKDLLNPQMVYHGEKGLEDILTRILDHPEILECRSEEICCVFHVINMTEHQKAVEEKLYQPQMK